MVSSLRLIEVSGICNLPSILCPPPGINSITICNFSHHMIIFQSWKIEVIDFNSQFRSLIALFQFFYTELLKRHLCYKTKRQSLVSMWCVLGFRYRSKLDTCRSTCLIFLTWQACNPNPNKTFWLWYDHSRGPVLTEYCSD